MRQLRRLKDLSDSQRQVLDANIGKLKEICFDDHDWQECYFGVRTGNWLPGKIAVYSPAWIHQIDWPALEIRINMPKVA